LPVPTFETPIELKPVDLPSFDRVLIEEYSLEKPKYFCTYSKSNVFNPPCITEPILKIRQFKLTDDVKKEGCVFIDVKKRVTSPKFNINLLEPGSLTQLPAFTEMKIETDPEFWFQHCVKKDVPEVEACKYDGKMDLGQFFHEVSNEITEVSYICKRSDAEKQSYFLNA
jgi:hypothetical protein